MSKGYSLRILLLLVFLAGCRKGLEQIGPVTEATSDPTVTPIASPSIETTNSSQNAAPTPTAVRECDKDVESGYWNGDKFRGQPVYGLQCGISQTAHEAFSACGLGDEQILEIVEYHTQRRHRLLVEGSTMVLSILGEPEATPTWSRSYSARTVAPGVFLVECESLN